jgi:hypothetical protein
MYKVSVRYRHVVNRKDKGYLSTFDMPATQKSESYAQCLYSCMVSISLNQLHHGGHLDRSALGASLMQKLTHIGFAQELIRSTNVNQDLVERINLDGSISRLRSLDHVPLEVPWCFS